MAKSSEASLVKESGDGGSQDASIHPLKTLQDEPLIFVDDQERPLAGVYIDKAETQKNKLVVSGWSYGHKEFTLADDNGVLETVPRYFSRPDVAETFGLQESDDGFGFTLTLEKAEANKPYYFCWRVEESHNYLQYPLRLEASQPADKKSKDEQTKNKKKASVAGKITIDEAIGPYVLGWAYADKTATDLWVHTGGKTLGKIVPNTDRADVKDALSLDEKTLGFRAMLGGVLQFSVLSKACDELSLSSVISEQIQQTVKLKDYDDQAATFSPLRALSREAFPETIGKIRDVRAVNAHEYVLLFETATLTTPGEGEDAPAIPQEITIDFYQEEQPGVLTRLERAMLTLDGSMVNIELAVSSSTSPILFVVTNNEREILLSDVMPLPVLFAAEHMRLIDYHSLLANGQPAFDTNTKLQRNILQYALASNEPAHTVASSVPSPQNTALLLYDRGVFDAISDVTPCAIDQAFCETLRLDRDGQVIDGNNKTKKPETYLKNSEAEYVLLLDASTTLRPDFWAIFSQALRQEEKTASVYYWDSIVTHGNSRPYVVKNSLLCDEVFAGCNMNPIQSAILSKNALQAVLKDNKAKVKSGGLYLERLLARISTESAMHIPAVCEQYRVPYETLMQTRLWDEQVPIAHTAASPGRKQKGGVSVIVNYRNAPDDTKRCLDSIKAQEFDGELEIILVNNGSSINIAQDIIAHAESLFGAKHVQTINYNKAFNHSKQCNLAASKATHPYLLMWSNDAVFVTPDALANAREIAAIEWVGSCGFRIIRHKDGKNTLSNMGLDYAKGPYLFAGGAVMQGNIPPRFMQDNTMEVPGNTFAAVMIRKQVYEQLGGLDEEMFPTNYNDVDFSFRSTSAGFRHIVIGSAIVQHVGRGSREMDLDLPINPKIIERMPAHHLLVRLGVHQL